MREDARKLKFDGEGRGVWLRLRIVHTIETLDIIIESPTLCLVDPFAGLLICPLR
jgi:hypothetical protein